MNAATSWQWMQRNGRGILGSSALIALNNERQISSGFNPNGVDLVSGQALAADEYC